MKPKRPHTYLPELYLRVGPYKLANMGKEIYCGHENGEGGTFTEAQLLRYIEEFFREHF